VLANRLTAQREIEVLLVEAGPPDCSIFIHMPSAFAYPLAGRTFNWAYQTEPEPHMDGRRISCPRGRVLGACRRSTAFTSAPRADYDGWPREGSRALARAQCLPYFKRAETRLRALTTTGGGGPPMHDGR
jgi:choline dehydrogenase